MTMEHEETITIIQHDWNLAISEGKSFFIGRRQRDTPTAFLNIKATGSSLTFDPTPDFKYRISLENNRLAVEASGLTSIFVPPCQEYDCFDGEMYNSISCIPAGGLLLAAGDKGVLSVINIETGERMIKLEGHAMDIYKCRMFPSGLIALTAGMDGTVRLWSLELKECVRTFKGHTQAVVDIGIIGIGKEVVSCSKDGSLIHWLCSDNSIINKWELEAGECSSLAVCNDSSKVLVTCEYKTFLIDLQSKELISLDFNTVLSTCCFDLNNSNVYFGDEQGTIHQCDIGLKVIIARRFTSRGKLLKLLHSRMGLVGSFNDGTSCCYSTMDTQEVIEFTGADCDPVYDISISDHFIYSICRDKIIRKYKFEGKSFFIGRRQRDTPTAFLNIKATGSSLTFDPTPDFKYRISLENNRLAVEASGLTSIFVPPCQEYDCFDGEMYNSISCIPAGGLLLAAGDKGVLSVINIETGERMIKLEGHAMDIYKCRMFPSGLIALTAGMDGTVRLWSLELKECVRTFKGHTQAVVDIGIIGIGKEVVSCSKDGSLIHWLCSDNSIINKWELEAGECSSLAVCNDSSKVLVTCEYKTFLIDLQSKELISLDFNTVLSTCCFDLNNSNVYFGDEQGTIHQCDIGLKVIIARRFTSRGKLLKLLHSRMGLVGSFNDGTSCCYSTMDTQEVIEFTGADCDPVYDISISDHFIYSICRDKIIRKYKL